MATSVRAQTNYDGLEDIPSREPNPYQNAASYELCDDSAAVRLIWGQGAWPLLGQSRLPAGPDAGAMPDGRALAYIPSCAACGGRQKRRGEYCAVCDQPRGSLATASFRRRIDARAEKKSRKLRGGTDGKKTA